LEIVRKTPSSNERDNLFQRLGWDTTDKIYKSIFLHKSINSDNLKIGLQLPIRSANADSAKYMPNSAICALYWKLLIKDYLDYYCPHYNPRR
jgi:hypothetical protein